MAGQQWANCSTEGIATDTWLSRSRWERCDVIRKGVWKQEATYCSTGCHLLDADNDGGFSDPDGTNHSAGVPAPCKNDKPIYPNGYFGPYVGPDPHWIPGFDPELPDNSPPEWIDEPNTRTLESPHD